MKELIDFLWKNFSQRDKKFFSVVILMTLLSSILEVVSIGMVVPVISLLIDPEKITHSGFFNGIGWIGINKDNVITYTVLSFICVVVFSSIFRVYSIRFTARFSFLFGAKISEIAYKKVLHRSYSEHKSNHSGDDVAKLITKINVVIQSLIFPVIMFGSAILMFFLIFLVFSFVNFKLTFTLATGLFLIYFLISWFFKKSLSKNSVMISSMQTRQIKNVQESLLAIREIIIDNTYSYYEKKYSESENRLRECQSNNIYVAQAPRYFIEAISIVFIMCFFYFFAFKLHLIERDLILPTFIAIAVALQRILPIAQQAYRSWANIIGNKSSLYEVMFLMNDEKALASKKSREIGFDEKMELIDVAYIYPSSKKNVLNSINLTIKKGEMIGVVGETGSGKSTLIDIVLGLLEPSSGKFLVDDVVIDKLNVSGWFKKISHVPQSVPIFDQNVISNIVMGDLEKTPDIERVKNVMEMCCLSDSFIENGEISLKSLGDNGKKISGGQKQRIGIARCLYKGSDLIVLDEATSALDQNTEKKIMENIYQLSHKPTIIMIAHRLISLKNCDKIIEIKNGKIIQIGSYEKVLGGENEF